MFIFTFYVNFINYGKKLKLRYLDKILYGWIHVTSSMYLIKFHSNNTSLEQFAQGSILSTLT